MEVMTSHDLGRIIDILMEKEETDLITKLRIHFEELFDSDYKPPRRVKKERYSESEGSAEEEEEYYTIEDEHGFLSLA